MLDKVTLRANAALRLRDAEVLFNNGQYDGAAYLCGYAVEFALKARICDTLNIMTYPDHIAGLKTHKLETLLLLTGQESAIKQHAFSDWLFVVQNWQPEIRYRAAGTLLSADVQNLLRAVNALLLRL